MNNEIITPDTDITAVDTPDVPVEHLENIENVSVRETDKTSKTDKRLEKLTVLREKYEKAASAQAAAEKKTQSINAQIAKIEKELHAEEVSELDCACAKRNLSYREIAEFIGSIPEDMTLADIKKMLS